MSTYYGDIDPGDTIRFPFNTRDTDGAPITLASGAIRVYKDDGTTEDDSGITLNTDFDSKTGLHLVEIDTSADGTFYSTGADFMVALSAGTVDSISVTGVTVGTFSIQNRSTEKTYAYLGTNLGLLGANATEAGGTGDHLTALATQASVDDLPTNAELATALAAADDAVLAQVALVKAKTDNLPSDPADQSLVIAATDALSTLIADIPTVAEFEARTIAAADYATATAVGDLPTNAELATALASADDAVLAAIAALNDLSAAEVNAELLDVLSVDTFAQPGQESPAATQTLVKMISFLYKAWRNRKTQTASEFALYADDGSTKDQEAAVSDDGTTFVQAEMQSGA